MALGKIAAIALSGGAKLALSFDDGRRATVDLAPVIAGRSALAGLADASAFSNVRLSEDGWSVEWPDLGIDFGAQQLRRWADEQSGHTMSAQSFRAWVDRHKLTLDRAAEALGLSRRTIAYYLSGEQPVPRTVMLATEGFEARRVA